MPSIIILATFAYTLEMLWRYQRGVIKRSTLNTVDNRTKVKTMFDKLINIQPYIYTDRSTPHKSGVEQEIA
jgi:ribosomal protein S3AE